MADQLLVQGTTDCPTILANGPEGYYLGISNGKLTWLPLSTDIALLLRSRSLSISQSGTSNHTADIELGSIDGLSDVDTTTNGPSVGHVLTWNGTEWIPKAAGGHPAAQIVQSDAPFSANPTTQVFRLPAVPILSGDATTGELTFKPGDGTTVTFDLCSLIATCVKNFRTSTGSGVPTATANDPLIWKDTLTNNVYIRDVTGVVTLVNDPVDISNGDGPPSVVTNDPTIYTDDLTGDIYYRDSSGATVKIYASLSIPITSGNGTPSATANSPTVYEDLLTGSVYYRDTTGNLILLFSRPTPVAAYEYTAKDSTNRIWTFDAASSTSTGNGATLTTYAWSITPVGTAAAATIATPAASSTTITFPSTGSWLLTLTVTDSNGNAQAVTKLIEVADTVLVAAYEITSKVALTATFDGSTSVGAATYAWTDVPLNGTVGAVTWGTPAAAVTTAVFPRDGEWQITLTVTSADGQVKTITKNIGVARYLQVNGAMTEINGQYFNSLQAAFDWINTNDAANAALYTIVVQSVTRDTGRITPNTARVHFETRGLVLFGVDFPAGIYRWTGTIDTNTLMNGIGSTAGSAITAVAGSILQIEGIGINCTDATAYAIDGDSWTGVFHKCDIFGSGGCIRILSTTSRSSMNFYFCAINARGATIPTIVATNCGLVMEWCRITHTRYTVLRLFADITGRIQACDFNSGASTTAGEIVAGIELDLTNAQTRTLVIKDCQVNIGNNGVAPGYACAAHIIGNGGNIYWDTCFLNSTQYGVVLQNTIGNSLLMSNCAIRGSTNSVICSSSLVSIVPAAVTARIHNSTLDGGAPQALVTFAAGVARVTNWSV